MANSSSADTARQMGMDWWSRDPFFSGAQAEVASGDGDEVRTLQERVAELEELVRRAGLPAGERQPAAEQQPAAEDRT